MNVSAQQKKKVLLVLQRMVYASTEQAYFELYEELCAMNLGKVREYFDKNWHPIHIRKQWASHYTTYSQNYMNLTTNRLESINQKIKTVVTKYGTLYNFLKETLNCIESMSLERDQRTIRSIHRKPVIKGNETVDEHSYRSLLTNFAFQKFFYEKQRVGNVIFVGESDGKLIYKSRAEDKALYSMDLEGKVCSCPFQKMMALPCRHLIASRRERQMDLFLPELCHQRWHKSYLPSNLLGDPEYIQKETIMSQAEKFRKAHEKLKIVAEMLSEKSSAAFETHMKALDGMAEAIANDKFFNIVEIGASNDYLNIKRAKYVRNLYRFV